MTQVDIITASPYQTMTIKLENGQDLKLTLRYSYNQSGWFYSFVYNQTGYKVNNKRIVQSVNILRGIKNSIPFGLACLATDKYEPVFITDFQLGRAKLYTLNSTDVALVESTLRGFK